MTGLIPFDHILQMSFTDFARAGKLDLLVKKEFDHIRDCPKCQRQIEFFKRFASYEKQPVLKQGDELLFRSSMLDVRVHNYNRLIRELLDHGDVYIVDNYADIAVPLVVIPRHENKVIFYFKSGFNVYSIAKNFSLPNNVVLDYSREIPSYVSGFIVGEGNDCLVKSNDNDDFRIYENNVEKCDELREIVRNLQYKN